MSTNVQLLGLNPQQRIDQIKDKETDSTKTKNTSLLFKTHLGNDKSKPIENTCEELKKNAENTQKIFLATLKNPIPGESTDMTKVLEFMMTIFKMNEQVKLQDIQQQNFEMNTAVLNHGLTKFIGQIGEYASNEFEYDGQYQTIRYTIEDNLQDVTLQVYKAGDSTPIHHEVVSGTFGMQEFIFQKDDIEAGDYTIFIEGKNEEGNSVMIQPMIQKRIDGIDYSQGPIGVPYSGSTPLHSLSRLIQHKTAELYNQDLEKSIKNQSVLNLV